MAMTLRFNSVSRLKKILTPKAEEFTAVNLGSCYLKGACVREGKAADWFAWKNNGLPDTVREISGDKKKYPGKVKLSVKSSVCLVRCFPFPRMDRKKQKQSLFYEMNKFIPFSPAEVYFDFSVIKEMNAKQDLILLAVAKKKFIDNILKSFDDKGVPVFDITLDSVCLMNLFLHSCEESTQVNAGILDIGYDISTLSLVSKGVPFLVRDVKLNVRELFSVVSRIKDVPLEGVENWLLGLKDKQEFLKLIHGSISHLCEEIKSSFDYLEVNKGEHIDKLYLSGGLASVSGIEELFSQALGIAIEPLKADGVFSARQNPLPADSFAVVSGLVV